MIGMRHPFADSVAIAGASTTGFEARNTDCSQLSYVTDACVRVLRDCGLQASDIDGLCGSLPEAPSVQAALGIPEIQWFANPAIPFLNQLAAAASAVHSGLCTVALAYHGSYRQSWNTASALRDPFRRGPGGSPTGLPPPPESVHGAPGYTAWASRYLHEYSVTREQIGLLVLNARTNAMANPAAAMRSPLTMYDYLNARMIRWPLCLLDMEMPVDGADAFIITTAERAADMPRHPVLIHALSLGMINQCDEAQTPSLRQHGQQVVVKALRSRCSFWIEDVDVYFPYDGFSIIALNWLENAGWCGPGEAGLFLDEHWDVDLGRIMIGGKVPINTHGGSLSEGGTQGSGHLREAVHQLQWSAGERQVKGAQRALVTGGGFFFNSQGVMLRRA